MSDYIRIGADYRVSTPPRLVSVFFTMFDDDLGRSLLYEVPEGSIKSLPNSTPLINFSSISEYIIPKPDLCGHLVSICTGSYKVMGVPVLIRNKKYPRGILIFNLSLVFDHGADTSSYEPVARKIARVLTSLEVESEFLWKLETRSTVYNIIEQLLEDLNNYCECQIPINETNALNLKLFPTYPNPQPVYDYQVPICTVDLNTLIDMNWDITVKKVVAHINGVLHVKKIAEIADVDCKLARECMEHILYYGCIIMIDIFQFSNIYAIRPEIMRIIEDETIQAECISYVTKPGATAPPFSKIFSLYCSLKRDVTIKMWVEENKVNSLNIDTRRFIAFGVTKGFLQRIHKYPVLPASAASSCKLDPHLKKLLNGRHHYDDICTSEGYSRENLDKLLGDIPQIKFIWK
ncbi:7666_t:CDS:2 [Paraglomus occultum]|uniref:7666_t:CDS:1 n=1 Tax=Paraglomus occultum TaxID=144539 RepID=A0A9N9F836_9GLOM|nr:7666_t:CDS:2 [Paraglomus occultum]